MSLSFISAAAHSPTITATATTESEIASCATHITLPGELERIPQTAPSSEMDDQASLDPSLASSYSTAMPECSSTQCNTPVHCVAKGVAGYGMPPLHRAPSTDGCGVHAPEMYRLAAEDASVRAAIAVNVKNLFHALTGFDVDEILDLLFVRETWFSAEVVIHALCLVNRLSFRFPYWFEHAIESDTDVSSNADSPVRGHSAASTARLPHICSSTSSDFSHLDNTDAISEPAFEMAGRSLARSCSASTNSLGEVFTRSNSPRCMMALLLLSSKFHGDIVYNTASLSSAMNKFRDEQLKMQAATPLSLSLPRRKPMLRVQAATLGQCEKRLFSELGCSVFVHKEEFQYCEGLVLRGL